MDVERRAALEGADDTIAVRKKSHLEGEKQVEWPADLPDQIEPVPEVFKTPGRARKTDEVIPCGLSVMYAVFSDTRLLFF